MSMLFVRNRISHIGVKHTARRTEAAASLDQVPVHDEEAQIAFSQGLIHTNSTETRIGVLRFTFHRWLPVACRAVAALRQPDAAGGRTKVPPVRQHGQPHLRSHAFICPQ